MRYLLILEVVFGAQLMTFTKRRGHMLSTKLGKPVQAPATGQSGGWRSPVDYTGQSGSVEFE